MRTRRWQVVAVCAVLAGCGDDGATGRAGDTASGDAGGQVDGGGGDDAATTGPRIGAITPDHVSALGGSVRVDGEGLAPATEVTVGGQRAAFVVADGALDVVVPPMTERVAAVVVVTPDGTVTDADGLRIEALEPVWTPAPAWWSPDLGLGGATDLVAADTDGDGVDELWVAGPGGLRRVDARASSAAVSTIDAVTGPAGALLVRDVDGDGFDDVFVCGGADGAAFVAGAAAGPAVRPGAVPTAAGACVAATWAGDDVVAVVSAGGGRLALRRYVGDGAGAWTIDLGLEPVTVSDEAIGETSSSDPGATLVGERSSLLAASGAAAGRFFYQLTGEGGEAIWRLPVETPPVAVDPVQLSVFGSATGAAVALALVDADGGRVEVPLGPDSEAAWREVSADGVGPGEGWSGRPVAVEIIVRPVEPVLGGELFIDEIVGVEADGGVHVLESFERATFATSWPGARATIAVTADADPMSLVVAPGPGDACLGGLALDGGALAEVAGDVAGRCVAVASRDVDQDGDRDLWIGVEGGQDRWWLNDGFDVWFDATSSTLPVDFADARDADFADLDLDGRADIVIANAGQSDRCYLATPAVRYDDHTPGCGFDSNASVAIAIGDVDGDGAPDIASVDDTGRLTLRLWTGGEAP